MTVPVYPEDQRALERAIQSLEAEEKVLAVWGSHSVELTLALEGLRSLRDRIQEERAELLEGITARPAYPSPATDPRLRVV
jgi:hypothetical protein